MKFSAHRCKRGYEAARERMRDAATEADRQKWNGIAQMWLSRWKEAPQ